VDRVRTLRKSDDGVANAVGFTYWPLGQVRKVLQDHDGDLDLASGTTDPDTSGNTRKVEYVFSSAGVSATNGDNFSRLTELKYPGNTQTSTPDPLALGYGAAGGSDHRAGRIATMSLNSMSIVEYDRIGLGIFAVVDLAGADVQLDRSFSHNGTRNAAGHTGNAGIYPGLDRFGRVVRHAWLDGDLGPQSPLASVPDRPPVVELLYTYDRASNRRSAMDDRPGATLGLSHQYDYDGLHRLAEAKRGLWNGSTFQHGVGSRKWTLDMLGNWATVLTNLNGDDSSGDPDYTDSGETETRTHNGVNELTARNLDGTGGDEVTLTYDKAGNLRISAVASGPTTTYTHDCWNRLVAVEVTPNAGSPSTRARYDYNGLTWRTRKLSDSDLSAESGDAALDEERVMTYSANWQILEERIDRDYQSDAGVNARSQYVWGIRYIDDCVLHRRDEKQSSTAPNGTYGDTNEGTWYHLTDAQFSTVCLLWPSGEVAERVTYSAYGEARHHRGSDVTGDGAADGADTGIILAAWDTAIGDSGYVVEADVNRDGVIGGADLGLHLGNLGSALASGEISLRTAGGPDNVIGWDGYVFNPETKAYKVRFRDYEPVLGRWWQRDPAGYVDGGSLYEYCNGAPVGQLDPSGLKGGIAQPAPVRPMPQLTPRRPMGPRIPRPNWIPNGPTRPLAAPGFQELPAWQKPGEWHLPVIVPVGPVPSVPNLFVPPRKQLIPLPQPSIDPSEFPHLWPVRCPSHVNDNSPVCRALQSAKDFACSQPRSCERIWKDITGRHSVYLSLGITDNSLCDRIREALHRSDRCASLRRIRWRLGCHGRDMNHWRAMMQEIHNAVECRTLLELCEELNPSNLWPLWPRLTPGVR